MSNFNYLIQGIDTIECAYYLNRHEDSLIDFVSLAVQKEELSRSKIKGGKSLKLGTEEFMLASHGTSSGYTFLMENEAFIVQFGELVSPNFFVKFRSIALWHQGVFGLHQRFMNWAHSVGMSAFKPERLSRVDFAFDYFLPEIDFDEDSFISQADKDNQHRKNGKLQTLKFGTDQVVLRVYNKTDEINEKSHKTWLFELWDIDHDVWRIEWQVRKNMLRLLGITEFLSLQERQGDLLRVLVKDHTTLRSKTNDTNRSRWPIHSLWQDLIQRVNQMEGLGVVRELDEKALLEARLLRMAISVYGYLKRVAAIDLLYTGAEKSYMDEAFVHLQNMITEIHDPLTWQIDVNKRVKEMKLSEW